MLPEPMRQVGLLYDRWQRHLSPPPQFRYGTGGEGNILHHPWFQLRPPIKLSGPLMCGPLLVNQHVLRVYSEGVWWHRASNQGLPVCRPLL
ncbi:hypothetical protein TNCV_503991 [Trichonephila clavipes]|nr:hypothetical protein TNCV_503991 [Trichonephila clavipes]